ncbi:PREDICTED: putative FBD-associated F-box protein At5g53635 [Camelina sativa]|uniref:FBD-associated F-box protein At5g53635 n=1 Tax=Camelina sativa TaxID=90675 RepID=A0ABM0Y6N4_CAMSA|nr:PREDICTED: putative FBD-associated F-box protein At5g53635 [Camelina sativa]XP_010496378.1 PREDICTED: putative FBD-associated F-box protein At5g53635 [Camelina sativa]
MADQRLEEDRLSQLPDPLICQILSHLPTKDSVTTSVLSTRWRTLWLWVPCLDLAYWEILDFNHFRSFGDRFFDSSRASFINKVKLRIEDCYDVKVDTCYLKSWIDAAVKRKIQHLHVCCPPDTSYEMPPSLYTCETLVSLKLYEVVMLDDVESFFLPSLKTLHLKFIWYGKESIFESLVSRCPILEKLKIVGSEYGNVNVFQVLSTSLKKLCIKIEIDDPNFGLGFVIGAPRLRFLSITDKFETCILNELSSGGKVDISLPFVLEDLNEASISLRRSGVINSFLPGISKVRDMTICKDIFKLICQYSKKELLPQFGYMSRLHLTLRVSDLYMLPTFLESCPNLKSLILVWNSNSKKMRQEELSGFDSSVPECLLSSLEYVDIKTTISGRDAEWKLIMYFLENSTILKKLTLRLNYFCTDEKFLVKNILEIPRRSTTCQVVIY